MLGEAKKWLPVDADGRLWTVKETARVFTIVFAVLTVMVMLNTDFQTVTIPGLGIKFNPQLEWYWFALGAIFCGAVTQRLDVAQKERFAKNGNGTGPGTASLPPAPPDPPVA